MNWERSLKILSFKEALSKEPSYEFSRRSIFRWYSKTFNTPLHVVNTLPIFDVFQAYYEDHYCDLVDSGDPMSIQRELADLSKTDEELIEERRKQDREDMEMGALERSAMEDNRLADEQAKKNQVDKQKLIQEKLLRDQQAAKELEKSLDKDSLDTVLIKEQPLKEVNLSFTDLDNDLADLDAICLPSARI